MIGTLTKLPPRAIDGIGIAALIALVAATYAVGVRPALGRRAAADRDAITLAAEVASADAAAAEVAAAQKRLEQLRESQVEQLTLEPASQVNTRIGRLTALASEEALSIQQLTPGTPKSEAGKPFTAVPIRVQGGGSFMQCVGFLRRLRKEHRDIAVPAIGMAITEPASENTPARLEMTLDLVWHAAPEVSAGAKQP
jgi:Tfp pilus assembly protein PilO